MQKIKMKIKMSIMLVLVILLMIMAGVLGLQNRQHKKVIEIYEEYYVLDEEMDLVYRTWREWYQQYSEEEYYLKYRAEKYLRYLELKKIIGEFEK